MLDQQAQFLQQVIDLNKLVLEKLEAGETDELDNLYADIRIVEDNISRYDTEIQQLLAKSDGHLYKNKLSFINKLAAENLGLLYILKEKMQQVIGSFAQTLKEARTGTKLMRTMPKSSKMDSTFEFNV